jgi:DNA modification methylase
MKTMADASVDLVITSPPYNGNKPYGIFRDRMSVDDYVEFSRSWMTEAARLLHEDGALWINVANMRDPDGGTIPIEYLLWPIGKELGLTLIQSIVWHHRTGKPQVKKFTQITERWQFWTKRSKGFTWNLDDVRVAPKTRDRRNNPHGANPTDLWSFASLTHGSKARPAHPCPTPVAMLERIVKVCSDPGGLIIDPFGGSGSTAIAALRTGRRAVSIELDPKFHKVSRDRLKGI